MMYISSIQSNIQEKRTEYNLYTVVYAKLIHICFYKKIGLGSPKGIQAGLLGQKEGQYPFLGQFRFRTG